MQASKKIQIKGMVCQRCISSVKAGLESAGLRLAEVSLGHITLITETSISDMSLIENELLPLGFSLIEDKKIRLIKIIKSIIEEIYSGEFDFPNRFRYSDLLSRRLNQDYAAISNLFRLLEKTTLEKYIIDFRIEKVKELMVYTNDTLADISFKLGFSSVAHLSRQFKLITGATLSQFKSSNAKIGKVTQAA